MRFSRSSMLLLSPRPARGCVPRRAGRTPSACAGARVRLRGGSGHRGDGGDLGWRSHQVPRDPRRARPGPAWWGRGAAHPSLRGHPRLAPRLADLRPPRGSPLGADGGQRRPPSVGPARAVAGRAASGGRAVLSLAPGHVRGPGAARVLARRPAAPGGPARGAGWTAADARAGHRQRGPGAPAGARGARPADRHPPTLDGVLDDEAWKGATPLTLVDSLDGSGPRSSAPRCAWSGTTRRSTSPSTARTRTSGARSRKRDEPLYTQEVVEVFLDADADGRTYDEIEVSAHNVVFDAYFPARRQGMDLVLGLGAAERGEGRRHHRRRERPRPGLDGGDAHPLRPPVMRCRTSAEAGRPLALQPLPARAARTGRTSQGQAFSPLFVGDFHAVDRFAWLVFDGRETVSRCGTPSDSRPRSDALGSPRKCRYPWSSSVSTTDSASSWLKPCRSTSASRIFALPRR